MNFSLSRRDLLAATGLSAALVGTSLIAAQERRSIATSMPILQDIVANITGDKADVFSILPANADPHTWEATPDVMVQVAESDAFIFNGANLEPFVETGGWHQTVSDAGIPEFQVAEHVDLIHIDEKIEHGDHEHDLAEGDPHIWLDPLTIVQAVPAIAEFLGEIDADNADVFAANAAAYVAELEGLHAELEASFEAIPDDRRKLLVFHDAWRYFAARYHFEIIGIVLENPDAEISAREMVDLLDVVQESGVDVIFAEPQFNTSVLDLLESEGDVRIEILLTDSFAEGITSYTELMRFNRDQLVNALAE